MRARIALIVLLVMLVVSCGGNGSAPPGTTAASPTTAANGATGTTAGSSATTATQPAPSGGDAAVLVEIDGTRYELSVRDDIPFAVAPGTMIPTRCEPNFFNSGQFWVIGVEVNPDGSQVSGGWQVDVNLYPSGEWDNRGFKFDSQGAGASWIMDEEDPGSWTIAGNRHQGEINLVSLKDADPTTARIDITCP